MSIPIRYFRALATASLPLLILLCATRPAPAQYDPPTGYYSTATGTGATLKGQLHAIIAVNWYNAGSSCHRITTA
jgi:hypothetical protein